MQVKKRKEYKVASLSGRVSCCTSNTPDLNKNRSTGSENFRPWNAFPISSYFFSSSFFFLHMFLAFSQTTRRWECFAISFIFSSLSCSLSLVDLVHPSLLPCVQSHKAMRKEWIYSIAKEHGSKNKLEVRGEDSVTSIWKRSRVFISKMFIFSQLCLEEAEFLIEMGLKVHFIFFVSIPTPFLFC